MIGNDRFFRLGDCFEDRGGEVWMIAASGGDSNRDVSLYCIKGHVGSRWTMPQTVGSCYMITCAEIKRLIGVSWRNWKYVRVAGVRCGSRERFECGEDYVDIRRRVLEDHGLDEDGREAESLVVGEWEDAVTSKILF